MPKFHATIQLKDLDGDTAAAVRQALDEKLTQAGFTNWRVLTVDSDVKVVARPLVKPLPQQPQPFNTGGLLLIGAVTWALWFFWKLGETMLGE